MAKLAKSRRSSHWDTLTDEQLLDTELETNNPDSLADVIDYLPAGYLDAFVEFKYDLRGTGSDDFVCVHGRHKHLAGFVMNKDGLRFKFGWKCAADTYGTKFESYKSDYNAAVNRKLQAVRRQKYIHIAGEIKGWINDFMATNVISLYQETKDNIANFLPWIWEFARETPNFDASLQDLLMPHPLSLTIDPERRLKQANLGVDEILALLRSEQAINPKQEASIKARLDGVIRSVKVSLSHLEKLVDFFQPKVLTPLCEFATAMDNPQKRQYEANFLMIACHRGRKPQIIVKLPSGFILPGLTELNDMQEKLRVI